MNVYVVAAHPDDEILGAGGTIAKHIQNGDKVKVLIVAEGKSSRLDRYEDFVIEDAVKYRKETKEALETLGVHDFSMLNFPDNRLDRMDMLDIIKAITKDAEDFRPERVYTHFYNDLNIDHQIVSRAVVTAFRALPDTSVKDILFFEVLSSTEHDFAMRNAFCPNYFVDISEQLNVKLDALAHYKSELREEPYTRNQNMVRCNSVLWGSKIGIEAAEAFEVSRIVR